MKNLIVVASLFMSVIASAQDSKDLDVYLDQLARYEITALKSNIKNLKDDELSNLQNSVGLSKFGKCVAVKGISQPLLVVGSLVGSVVLELANPLANVVSYLAGEIPGYVAWSNTKKAAADLNPVSLYDMSNEDLNKELNCERLNSLHQMVMEEASQRQTRIKSSTELVKSDPSNQLEVEGQRIIEIGPLRPQGAF